MIENVLIQLGLSEKEARIYLALLPLGRAPASTLGLRTGIGRSMAQYLCQQLVKRRIVRAARRGQALFYAPEPPERLRSILSEEQVRLDQKRESLERIMGPLAGMLNPQALLPKVRFFEGADGIIQLYEDLLAQCLPQLGCASYVERIDDRVSKYMQQEYIPRRIEAGNSAWMLFNDVPLSRTFVKRDRQFRRTSLLVPSRDFPFPSSIHLYGPSVACFSLHPADMTGILIENAAIAKTMRTLFRLAWDTARSLPVNRRSKGEELPPEIFFDRPRRV